MAGKRPENCRIGELISALYGRCYRFCRPSRYHEYAVVRTASRYDMTSAPSEQYYAEIYLRFIREDLQAHFGPRKIAVLDAGCGQGRISLPLAADGHAVTGWDLSSDVIAKARAYAKERSLEIDYHVADLSKVEMTERKLAYDCILCLEVLYMTKDPVAILRSFRNLLTKNGLLIVSLRPQYYYQLQAVLGRRLDDPVFDPASDGGLLNGLYFNWITRERWAGICDSLDLRPVHCYGIGVFSGIPGDPLAGICIPSERPEAERAGLMKNELANAEALAYSGRYVYLCATLK